MTKTPNPNRVKPDPEKWITLLDDMIESGEFIFAEEFLTSVREQVEEKGTITAKQTSAVLNIRRSIQ